MRYFYRTTAKVGPLAAGWNKLAKETVVRVATETGSTYPVRKSVFEKNFAPC